MKIEFTDTDPAIRFLKGVLTVDQFNEFLRLAEQPELKLPAPEDLPIVLTGLSGRIGNLLRREGLTTTGKLARYEADIAWKRGRTIERVLALEPNIGKLSVKELEEHLRKQGITFEMLNEIRFRA